MTDETTEIAVAQEPRSLLSAIVQMASNPAVDVTKLEAILKMQERMEAREAERAFSEAMARLQPKLPRITKTKEVRYPIDKSRPDGPTKAAFKYAPIEKIDDVIRPLLNEEGFSLSADTETQADGKIVVVGMLTHRAGHTKTTRCPPLPFDTSGGKNNAQAGVSSFSYGYRLCQRALLNLVFEGDDDDGVRGGAEPISDEEAAELSRGLTETNSDLTRFLQFMGVEAIPDIQKKDLARAKNLIAQKRQRVAT